MRFWLLGAFSFLLLSLPLGATTPVIIVYQGVLTDDNNQIGSSALWAETQTATTTRGVFTAVLGSVTALISASHSRCDWITIGGVSRGRYHRHAV